MQIPIPFIPAPRRVRRRPRTAAARPAAGPLVVTGIAELDYNSEYQLLYVTPAFNTSAANPLVGVEEASPAKWTARYLGKRFTATGLWQVADDRIQIELEWIADEAGEDELVYTNDPSDISDASGRTLAAFEMPL